MEDRELIIEKLKILSKLELGNVFWGIRGVPAPEEALFMKSARFNFILSGNKNITLPLPSGVETIHFNAGDMHCSLPDSWEQQTWDSSHEMLCFVPQAEYLRISYYQVSGKNHSKVNRFYHTDHSCSEAFQNTVNALQTLPYLNDYSSAEYLLKALIKLSIYECKQQHAKQNNDKSTITFNKVRIWLENSFSEDIDRVIAAKLFQLTPSYVSQLFTKKCDLSFHEYLTKCRIDFAKHLLKETNLTVYQVGYQCGFKNNVHFVRRFREITGISPGKYRAGYYT